MKAIEITQVGEMKQVDRELPTVREGEVLLKLKVVGFCGSDLSTYLGKNPLVQYPRIPGHEVSAVIEAVGTSVPDSFRKGLRVTVYPYTNCGKCSSCKQERFNACRYNETLGVQRDGAMSEFISLPWQKVIICEDLNELQLALVEPLSVGFHAVERARVTDSDYIMILGCGMIGAGAIICASLRGATVIAVDISEDKLKIASKLGAIHVINSKSQDLHEELTHITNGDGPGIVIEAAGNPATYKAALTEVAFAGRVTCIGYVKDDVSFATKLWVQKELEILGSRNADPADFEAVINFLKKGVLDEQLLISRVVDTGAAPEAMSRWAAAPENIMKVMVRFT